MADFFLLSRVSPYFSSQAAHVAPASLANLASGPGSHGGSAVPCAINLALEAPRAPTPASLYYKMGDLGGARSHELRRQWQELSLEREVRRSADLLTLGRQK